MNQSKEKSLSDKIFLSDTDFKRLSTLFESEDEKSWKWVDDLDEKLMNAEILESKKVPNNLVTMNSRILCRLPDRMVEERDPSPLTLVYPNDANINDNKVSVLSNIGRAILGRCIGEVITWKGNDGFQRRLKLERMEYQPESNGDWHL